MRIGKDWMICLMMMRLGPVLIEAVLHIPQASILNDNEAGAGVDGSSAPDTTSDDETLGPVYVEVVLPIPPVGLMH